MWNLNKEVDICISQIKEAGIIRGRIKGVHSHHRLRSTWGFCRLLEDGWYDIYINSRLLSGDIPLESLRATIVHVILHTCPGCFDHGRRWKENARIMQERYGYKITRLSSAQDLGVRDGERIAVLEKVPKERRLKASVGDYVEHIDLGPGIITRIEPIGSDVLLTVRFQDNSSRQFMQSLAASKLVVVDCERTVEHTKSYIDRGK